MAIFSQTALLFITVVVRLFAEAPPEMAGVLNNVKSNEQLYSDIDVTVASTYELATGIEPVQNEVQQERASTRVVNQGAWYRVERRGETSGDYGTGNRNRVRTFDGEKTRWLERDAVANESAGRVENDTVLAPHLLLLQYARLAVPLSVYLEGGDSFRTHPLARLQEDMSTTRSVEAVETVNGVRCVKLQIVNFYKGIRHDSLLLWLAEDRNYIPVRHEAFIYRVSDKLPVLIGQIDEFQEILPGVWFPMRASIVRFDDDEAEHGKQVARWTTQYVTESIDLLPKHERSFFSTVSYPKGVIVHEVRGREVLSSRREGMQDAPKRIWSGWSWLWAFAALNILCVCVVALAVRVWRHRTTSSTSVP